MKFYVSTYDVPSRTYEVSAAENITEDLGTMIRDNSTLNVNMMGNNINGTTDSTSHKGITVKSGQTLNIYGADTALATPVAGKISGFTSENGVFINNSGTVYIENTKFDSNKATINGGVIYNTAILNIFNSTFETS